MDKKTKGMNYMLVTNYFLLGNLTVPSSWVALIVAFVITYIGVRLKFGKHVADTLSDAIFYFIIVWKLSVIITDFGTVIHSPLSILYFHGGHIGVYLGLFAAMIKVLIGIKKHILYKDELVALFVSSILIQSIYQLLMVLLNEGPIIAQSVTVIAFGLFALVIWFMIDKMKDSFSWLAFLFIVIHLFISSFQQAGIFGTSVIATIMIGSFFAIVLSEKFINYYNRRELGE